jgi:hypothetical protein
MDQLARQVGKLEPDDPKRAELVKEIFRLTELAAEKKSGEDDENRCIDLNKWRRARGRNDDGELEINSPFLFSILADRFFIPYPDFSRRHYFFRINCYRNCYKPPPRPPRVTGRRPRTCRADFERMTERLTTLNGNF